jgi:ribosomal protein S27E
MPSAGRLRAMRRPPPPIEKLSDQLGDYVLAVKCRRCQHTRTTDPHVLAKILGWNVALTSLAQRLRCSKCHAKDCVLSTSHRPRPRGR